jgi:ABC-type multidrug transport system fused ATPase/permease subunit
MKSKIFLNSDYFSVIKLISHSDKIKLLTVSVIQIFLSFFDLIGVAFIGLVGSVSVAAISSTKVSGRTESVINFLGLQSLSSQYQVSVFGGMAAVLMVVKTFTSLYLNKRVLFYLSRRGAVITANLTANLFKRSYIDIKKQGSQNLIYSLTSGVNGITTGVLGGSVALIADISLLIILVAGLFFVNAFMTVVLLSSLSLVATIMYLFIRNKNKALAVLGAKYSIDASNKIFEAVGSYRELTLRGQRHYFAESIGKTRMLQADAGAQSSYLMNVNKYILEAAVILITLLISGIQFLLSNALRSVATLTLFFAAISRIAPAVFRIQQNLLTIKASLGMAKPTLDLIRSLNLSIDRPKDDRLHQIVPSEHREFSGFIKVSNLSFKYEGSSTYAVKNVNLDLSPGTQVAIVGPSGAGKSTLVDLLLGLHQPTSGSVVISGKSAVDAIEKWPGAVSYVPQEIQLVAGSIIENILLGFANEDVNRKKASNAMQMAALGEYLNNNNEILNLNIGDEGGKLSGGQRQRIGIARALLTNPKILILDEATSSLDAQTEENISSTIGKLRGDSLVVVVAHRLATVRKADVVVYMQDGQIMAKGTFEQVRELIPDFDTQAQLMGL